MDYIEELQSGKESKNDLVEKHDEVHEDEKNVSQNVKLTVKKMTVKLISEFDRARQNLINRKAPGLGEITIELVKSAECKVLERIFKLVDAILETA